MPEGSTARPRTPHLRHGYHPKEETLLDLGCKHTHPRTHTHPRMHAIAPVVTLSTGAALRSKTKSMPRQATGVAFRIYVCVRERERMRVCVHTYVCVCMCVCVRVCFCVRVWPTLFQKALSRLVVALLTSRTCMQPCVSVVFVGSARLFYPICLLREWRHNLTSNLTNYMIPSTVQYMVNARDMLCIIFSCWGGWVGGGTPAPPPL